MILSLCPNPSIDTLAQLENFEPGKVNRVGSLKEFPGGKGIHVALALAELGAPSRIFGNWAGNSGEWIKQHCEDRGLEVTGIDLQGNNRKCYTFQSGDPEFDNTELLEPGPDMRPENWEDFNRKFLEEIPAAAFVCMSGSWPRNAPEDAYLQVLRMTETTGTRVILDCSGKQLKNALKTNFFGLHLNQHEAFNFCGSSEIEDLQKALEGKVKLLALTKGKEGLILSYQGQTVHASLEIKNIISTVGSGDCLTAGLAYALSQDLDVREIAAYGVACGAANCIHEELGMLKREDVERLLPQVRIKQLHNEF